MYHQAYMCDCTDSHDGLMDFDFIIEGLKICGLCFVSKKKSVVESSLVKEIFLGTDIEVIDYLVKLLLNAL